MSLKALKLILRKILFRFTKVLINLAKAFFLFFVLFLLIFKIQEEEVLQENSAQNDNTNDDSLAYAQRVNSAEITPASQSVVLRGN